MDRRRNHRLNHHRRRLFLPLILSLGPYPGMPWHLYHYAMALWHLRHGARYQGQRLSKGCSVEKKKFCAISRSFGSPLGVVEVIHMGSSAQCEHPYFYLYLALASDYCSYVCLLFFMFHFHMCASARIRSLEQNNTCSNLEPSVVQRHQIGKASTTRRLCMSLHNSTMLPRMRVTTRCQVPSDIRKMQ